MISGFYIIQPKRSDMAHDQINVLLGPYATADEAMTAGPPFEAWFKSKYPGERVPLTFMGLQAWILPAGRFNADYPNAPAPYCATGFPKS